MKSWLTSIFGIAAGGFNMLANGTSWKQVLVSLGIAGLGVVAKDFNITGGTKSNQ